MGLGDLNSGTSHREMVGTAHSKLGALLLPHGI